MSVNYNSAILIVDDYQTMLRIMRKLLKQIGFENVDEASNGKEAIDKLHEKSYNLIISDWNMEPTTGYDLLISVRKNPAHSNTPFILVTAESKPENVIAAQKAGATDYLIKPFNAQILKDKIEKQLQI